MTDCTPGREPRKVAASFNCSCAKWFIALAHLQMLKLSLRNSLHAPEPSPGQPQTHSNRLQLNSDKTELLWCTTTIRQHQLPRSPLLADGTPIDPFHSVHYLAIFTDADLVERTHVHRMVSRRFVVLRHTSESTFSTDIYVPDSDRIADSLEAEPWEGRPGWPSDLSFSSASVDCERGCAAYLQLASFRSHH